MSPHYDAAGWLHWPAQPEWSAQFARMLGATQEGAGTVSECFQAASRMEVGDALSWHREWERLAEANARRAEAAALAGHALTARAHHLRASNYHRVSEMLLTAGDPLRRASFAKAVVQAHAHLRLLVPAGEVVQIDAGDGTRIDAYFLAPADGAARHPVVIAFGGLDSCKEEMVQRMASHALARGLALLLIDLPGQGEGLRFRGATLRHDAEVPLGRCVDYLRTRGEVDGDRIGLYGASLGGLCAARAASGEQRFRAVVSDSLIFELHAHFTERLARFGDADWDFAQWVFGCDSPAAVVERSRAFRMADFAAHIRCPWLIVQGEHDFLGLQTALDAFAFAQKNGVPAALRVFTAEETGAAHCQADNPSLGVAFVCDWLADRLCAS